METKHKTKKRFITFLLIFSLLLFLILIRNYLITLILAIIFTGVLYPVYQWMVVRLKGKQTLSATLVTFCFLLIIIIPSFYLLVEIIKQASEVSSKIIPIVESQIDQIGDSNRLPSWVPYADELQPYNAQIKEKLGVLIEKIGGNIISGIGSITQGTLSFFIELFIMLYAIFYFLTNGTQILQHVQKLVPLSSQEFNTIKTELHNTSWATIKGALVIGILQGTLVAISFAIVGIPGALFWGAVAALASLIPTVGCALVYVPAGIYLLLNQEHWQGIFVLVWGFGIVGTVDNILRPILVGRDTKISELTVLISTLGGITLFGLPGVILGPMIASLFSTMQNIYLEEKKHHFSQ